MRVKVRNIIDTLTSTLSQAPRNKASQTTTCSFTCSSGKYHIQELQAHKATYIQEPITYMFTQHKWVYLKSLTQGRNWHLQSGPAKPCAVPWEELALVSNKGLMHKKRSQKREEQATQHLHHAIEYMQLRKCITENNSVDVFILNR